MQKGFSLPEALIATLLLAVSLLGLLQYYQSLTQGFMRQWQFRQAWSEAHAQLDAYAITGKGYAASLVGWQSQIIAVAGVGGCKTVTARIQTPSGYIAQATRIICNSTAPPDR
ncbi:prepilin-type N-terminal cleavage/methylation domain-containing protein [Ewingella americana]|nr:prepilin-type N-terminal cleavage/methylation domain-containing protein [Ewingella americana]